MVTITLDSVTFRLKEYQDFSWLKPYGKAFWCVDETGSGCICIGMEKDDRKYFCKIAGVNTIEGEVTPEESVQILKKAVVLYRKLAHPNLIKLIEDYAYGPFYVAVFQWARGECLFDHWNFDTYKKNPALKTPRQRFLALPAAKKLAAADVLFSFLQNTTKQGYVAVDFYDGSILYDFTADTLTICDIDLFQKAPAVNDLGPDWYGTKRLKAPEEYVAGGIIDEQTSLFTLGALIFDFFGTYTDGEIRQRYTDCRFLPCSPSCWQLNQAAYDAAARAVSPRKEDRCKTLEEFSHQWHHALSSFCLKS